VHPGKIARHLKASQRASEAREEASDPAADFPRVVVHRQPLDASGRFFVALRRFFPTQLARVIAVEGSLPPHELATALRTLQARHPMLRARLLDDGVAPSFEHGAYTTLRPLLVERTSARHWQTVLTSVLATRDGRASAPLFAAHYVYDPEAARSELVLVADHTVADGVSMNHLCAELIGLCAGRASLPARPLLPPLEELLPHASPWLRAASFGTALARLTRVVLTRSLRERRTPVGGTSHLHRELTVEQTSRLLERARTERTTVTGALMAAAMLALELHPGDRSRRAITVPVDLRTRIREHELSAADLGHFTSVVYLAAHGGGTLWPLARQLKSQLEQTVGSPHLLAAVPLIYRAGRLFLRRARPPLSHAMVSNSGVVPFESSYGAFRVVGFYSGTSAPMLSADQAYFCNTLHGRLSINAIFSEQVVTRERAERALDDLVDSLTRL